MFDILLLQDVLPNGISGKISEFACIWSQPKYRSNPLMSKVTDSFIHPVSKYYWERPTPGHKRIFSNNAHSFLLPQGRAGQEEDPCAAPGVSHHRTLRHRLLDLLHRSPRGGARYKQNIFKWSSDSTEFLLFISRCLRICLSHSFCPDEVYVKYYERLRKSFNLVLAIVLGIPVYHLKAVSSFCKYVEYMHRERYNSNSLQGVYVYLDQIS